MCITTVAESSAIAQSSVAFSDMKNKGFWSCIHKQMPYWGEKCGLFFPPESLHKIGRKSCISSQQDTVSGRPGGRRRRPDTAPGNLLQSTKKRHGDRGISHQPLLLFLLQHEWLPASLPEHLMILILMTASVFLPVYWWIIIPFGTVSSVKLGTIIQVSTQG